MVQIHSGANSLWHFSSDGQGKSLPEQFAMDWKVISAMYGKLFYRISNYLTALFPTAVVFDNIFTKEYFENKFKRQFYFIPYGAEVKEPAGETAILKRIGITPGKYVLFVGRFIPDKGVHLLINAFEKTDTDKKLVLIGGSPNPSTYEEELHKTADKK